jgi:hypothetical protein
MRMRLRPNDELMGLLREPFTQWAVRHHLLRHMIGSGYVICLVMDYLTLEPDNWCLACLDVDGLCAQTCHAYFGRT